MAPHAQNHYRTPTPQSQPHPAYPLQNHTMNPYTNGAPNANAVYGNSSTGYGQPNPNPYGYQAPIGAPGAVAAGGLPDPFASIPEEQRAMIMRVIAMTPEQIGQLPPQERSSIIQLVRRSPMSHGRCAHMLVLPFLPTFPTLVAATTPTFHYDPVYSIREHPWVSRVDS